MAAPKSERRRKGMSDKDAERAAELSPSWSGATFGAVTFAMVTSVQQFGTLDFMAHPVIVGAFTLGGVAMGAMFGFKRMLVFELAIVAASALGVAVACWLRGGT